MAQNAAHHSYPPIFKTPISRAEVSDREVSETRDGDQAGTTRLEKGTPAPKNGPSGEDHQGGARPNGTEANSGELRRRFLRALGTLAALVGLALALLVSLSTGPNGSGGTRTPWETTSSTSPTEEPAKSASSESSSKPSKKNPDESEPSVTESSEAEASKSRSASSPSQAGRRSYSYLGSVSRSVPETRAVDNGTGTKRGSASETESPAGAKGQGDSPTQSNGQIPELTIRLGERSLEKVAAKFGYQMVAIGPSSKNSDESVVLGKIENGRLQPMKKTELEQYAGRARSARRHPEYNRLRRRVARRLSGRSAGTVRLIYLVPKKIEQAFVRAQIEAIRKRGLSPEEVAVVKARYRGDSIVVTDIERKSGSQAGSR